MDPTLDIEGESGQFYRFRQVDSQRELPASSGNFVFVRREGRIFTVVCSGFTADLRHAAPLWESVIREKVADRLLVRLNISRASREREHEDLVERHHPQMINPDHHEVR